MFEILIIDDTKSVHSFVKCLIARKLGLNTTSVFNGSEAIELLKTGKHFDAILLDWEMPIMDGPTTLENFKKVGIKIPTIMMTTKNDPDCIARMLGLGVSEYIIKPFTIDILFEKIEFVTGKAFDNAA